jgi:hypothetical protein
MVEGVVIYLLGKHLLKMFKEEGAPYSFCVMMLFCVFCTPMGLLVTGHHTLGWVSMAVLFPLIVFGVPFWGPAIGKLSKTGLKGKDG